MEDTSALWPVPVKTACVKEPVALLEKEVVCDQLLPLSFGQGVERVVCSGKLASEATASLNDLLFDGVSLLSGDCRAQGEVSQVAADSDTRRLNHGGVLWGKGWSIELTGIHVASMASRQLILVVVLDDGNEQIGE